MSVTDLDVKQKYNANGVLTTFAIPFDYNETDQISVYVVNESVTPVTETLQVISTDYTISGSNIVFNTAPTNGRKVLIIRESDFDQQTDYIENGEFPADAHEDALDYLTHQTQELKESLSRAALLRKSSSLSNLQFPDPSALKYIRWNTDADELEATNDGLWSTSGNSNVQTTDFIGSTNNAELKFRTNNVERGRIKADGQWVLGLHLWPTTDGSNGQVLVTNGAGTLSWATVTTSATSVSSISKNGSTELVGDVTLSGTANQITLTQTGQDINFSLPQNIHSGASPTFAGLTLTGLSGVLKATAGVISGSATTSDLTEGSNLYFTDERAQDAVGGMVDTTLVYTDGTPLLQRAALTGDVTASAGSNSTTIANDAVTYAKMQNVSATSRVLGRISSGSGDVEELTGANIATIANSSFDHGTLSGLSDDDHTQYVLLAGRSGGQSLTGGTGSGDDLTLSSTSHGTKGDILFGTDSRFDETNNSLAIGQLDTSFNVNSLSVVAKITADMSGDLIGIMNHLHAGSSAILAANLTLAKTRGTHGSPTIVSAGDTLGIIAGYGYTGNSGVGYQKAAQIRFVTPSTGTPSTTSMPGEITFYTTPDASVTPTLALTIKSDQSITAAGVITMSGAVIGSLSGVLKASSGTVSGSATTSDLTEGSNLYFTDERAQDAIGAMVDSSLVYTDGTPLLQRAALTGDVTASAGSNSTTIANDAVTYAKMQNVSATSRVLGRISSGAGDVEELTAANLATIANSTFDHGTLAGLTDDDHTQYALLAGRSGGQSLTGGTASGDDLTLISTSNATKGSIIFGTLSAYDQVNDRFGIGTLSPGAKLEIETDSASEVGQIIELAASQSADAFQILNSAGVKRSSFASSGLCRFWDSQTETVTSTLSAIEFGGTIALEGTTAGLFAYRWTTAMTYQTAGPAFGIMSTFFSAEAVCRLKIASTIWSGLRTFNAQIAYVADGVNVGIAGSLPTFNDNPSFTIENGGTWSTSGNYTAYNSGGSVGAGATVGTRRGFLVSDYSGAGTLATRIGFECAALTKATTNVSFRALGTGGSCRFVPKTKFGADSVPAVDVDINGAIAYAKATVSLTADNQTVTTSNRSYISLSSDNATATNRTFILAQSTVAGHILTLEWTGTNAGELIDDSAQGTGGNHRMAGNWTPTQYDTITFISNSVDWVEIARSTN